MKILSTEQKQRIYDAFARENGYSSSLGDLINTVAQAQLTQDEDKFQIYKDTMAGILHSKDAEHLFEIDRIIKANSHGYDALLKTTLEQKEDEHQRVIAEIFAGIDKIFYPMLASQAKHLKVIKSRYLNQSKE